MSKKILIGSSVGVVALITAAYAGTAWYAGKQFELQLNQNLSELKATSPFLAVSDLKIQRGVFSTQADLSLA